MQDWWQPVSDRESFSDVWNQWRIQNFIMGGRTVEGEGAQPLPRKNWIFTWNRWVLVHSRITFYVYAKIGEVNWGGGCPPPWIRHCLESAVDWLETGLFDHFFQKKSHIFSSVQDIVYSTNLATVECAFILIVGHTTFVAVTVTLFAMIPCYGSAVCWKWKVWGRYSFCLLRYCVLLLLLVSIALLSLSLYNLSVNSSVEIFGVKNCWRNPLDIFCLNSTICCIII